MITPDKEIENILPKVKSHKGNSLLGKEVTHGIQWIVPVFRESENIN